MKRATADPFVLFKVEGGKLDGLIVLQVVASLILTTDVFLNIEEVVNNFKAKDRKIVGRNHVLFNGVNITRGQGNVISLINDYKIYIITLPTTQKEFESRRAECKYI